MQDGIDNVMSRISQINERIREIRAFGRNAVYRNEAAAAPSSASSSAAGETSREEAFADALEQAILADAVKDSGDATLLGGTGEDRQESIIGIDNISAVDRILSDSVFSAENTVTAFSGSDNVPSLYGNLIQLTSGYFGLDSNLIKAVIKQESDFTSDAVSSKGAMGLMQLMPETAQELGVDDAFDPAKNIYGGTKYLQQMLARYKGDLDLALAAYNAGPARVDQAGGIPEIPETKNYVVKVRQYYEEYSKNPLK